MTAGDMRAMGLDVPADIPDCAVLRNPHLAHGDVKVDGQRITVPVTITADAWEWVEIECVIEPVKE